jgi:hypothetical protein
MSVSQGESSEDDSIDCSIGDFDEGRNENSLKYFNEHRDNYPVYNFTHIKGHLKLTDS